MAGVDYSHLVQIYRKSQNGPRLFYETVHCDHGYYCGSAKTAEARARDHAVAVAADELQSWNAELGTYIAIVFRVPADAQAPVPKDDRKLVVSVEVEWPPSTSKEAS